MTIHGRAPDHVPICEWLAAANDEQARVDLASRCAGALLLDKHGRFHFLGFDDVIDESDDEHDASARLVVYTPDDRGALSASSRDRRWLQDHVAGMALNILSESKDAAGRGKEHVEVETHVETYVCIHEIERSLNFNLYNTDYLWVPRASRAPTRGCSSARFLHCAIAPPRGFSAVTDKVVKKSRTHRDVLCIFMGPTLSGQRRYRTSEASSTYGPHHHAPRSATYRAHERPLSHGPTRGRDSGAQRPRLAHHKLPSKRTVQAGRAPLALVRRSDLVAVVWKASRQAQIGLAAERKQARLIQPGQRNPAISPSAISE